MALNVKFRDSNTIYPDTAGVPELKAVKMEKQVEALIIHCIGALLHTLWILFASGGHLPWRRNLLEASLIYCVTAAVLVPTAMLKASVESIPSSHSLSLCLIMCSPGSPEWLISFPTQRSDSMLPCSSTHRCCVCNSFHSFSQHGQSLLWPSWFSPQLPPYACSHHASAGGTFPCRWHLSGGDDDDSQLISVLKSRVTNKLSWGAMPLAKQQPIRTLMLPTMCQKLCMVQEQQQQHKHNSNPSVLGRKSEIWSNELWEHFIGNVFSSVACWSQGFGALWSLSYQKHFLLELKYSAGNYHKKKNTQDSDV